MIKKIIMVVLLLTIATMSMFAVNENQVILTYDGFNYTFLVVQYEGYDMYVYSGEEFGKCIDNVKAMFGLDGGTRSTEMEQAVGKDCVVYEYLHYKSGYRAYIVVGVSKEDPNKYAIIVVVPQGTKI
jgi:hypothetical protein